MRRGAPVLVAPVFRILVIFPKLAEGLGELPVKDPRLLDGFLYIGWLSRLKAAARKFKANLSDNLKVFVSELLRGDEAFSLRISAPVLRGQSARRQGLTRP